MKARDVLAAAIYDPADGTVDGGVDALLAQTPEGEGVYIAPDGELWRVDSEWTVTFDGPGEYEGDGMKPGKYVGLVPIEGADRD